MTEEQLQRRRLMEDPTFVVSKRHNDDLETLATHYDADGGCPDRIIASALLMTEEEVAAEYDAVVAILRRSMGA